MRHAAILPVVLFLWLGNDHFPLMDRQPTERFSTQLPVQTGLQDRQQDAKKAPIPPPRNFYKGRQIAQTMHFDGAPWLIRGSRESEERCSMLLPNIGLKPGMTVCDMGVGNGFYALKIAELIGDSGQVIGVDVQVEMLEKLVARMNENDVANITPVLGSYHDPHLEENTIDFVLMVDVYHEFSHPELMLNAIRRAMKPDGIICLVEYRTEDPKVPIKRLHKMSKTQIKKEYEPNGFKLVREFDRLPWQHVMIFAKDDRTMDEILKMQAEANNKDR